MAYKECYLVLSILHLYVEGHPSWVTFTAGRLSWAWREEKSVSMLWIVDSYIDTVAKATILATIVMV